MISICSSNSWSLIIFSASLWVCLLYVFLHIWLFLFFLLFNWAVCDFLLIFRSALDNYICNYFSVLCINSIILKGVAVFSIAWSILIIKSSYFYLKYILLFFYNNFCILSLLIQEKKDIHLPLFLYILEVWVVVFWYLILNLLLVIVYSMSRYQIYFFLCELSKY